MKGHELDMISLQLIKNALADLEGIMPEFEPSGERTHSGWKTITELKNFLNQRGKFMSNGYEIKYNSLWKKWQISHENIGACIAEFDFLKDAIEYSVKG